MRLAPRIFAAGLCAAAIVACGEASAGDYPIAGLTPYQRPEGAPVIKEFTKDKAFDEAFYHGVAKPYPPNLPYKDQGGWYTPFIHSGLAGPYDIRGWRKPYQGGQ